MPPHLPVPPSVRSAAGTVAPAALSAEIYRRLGLLCPVLGLEVVSPDAASRPGWISGQDLWTSATGLEDFLAARAARIQERYGRPARPDVVATRVLHAYLWDVCLLMSGPWYLAGRVPRVRPADVRIDPDGGRLGVVPGPFACLQDDPACDLPGVRVVATSQELEAELRDAVAEHARIALAGLGPRLRRGPRALWGMVGDDLISGIWHLGRALGQERPAVEAAERLLPGPVPPFPAGADFREVHDETGVTQPTRTRLGCCLFYTICPAEPCATCPRSGGAKQVPAAVPLPQTAARA